MNYLLDTHLILWATVTPARLSSKAKFLLEDQNNLIQFSPASLWEVVIKSALGREDFNVDPHVLRRALIDNDYIELPILSQHTVAIQQLPPLHKDPFDRILIAQATVEGVILLTTDRRVSSYPGPIQLV